MSRLAGGFSDEVKARVVFYSPDSVTSLLNAFAGAHVLLDPFPVSALLPNLQAISVGLPIITMPSNNLGGRFALALYRLLDYGINNETQTIDQTARGSSSTSGSSTAEKSNVYNNANNNRNNRNSMNIIDGGRYLVVNSINEYVTAALSICHKPKLREQHSAEIMKRKSRLYSTEVRRQAAEDWIIFFNTVVKGKNLQMKAFSETTF